MYLCVVLDNLLQCVEILSVLIICLMLAALGIKKNSMYTFSIKVVVGVNISYVETHKCHLIRQLLTVTLPHPLYLLPNFFVCHI